MSGAVESGAGGPNRIELPPAAARAQGRVDAVLDGRVLGWAWLPNEPSERLDVIVVVDGHEVATGVSDGHRSSLAAAGIGDGAHAFGVELPESLGDRDSHTLRVLAGPECTALPAALGYAVNAGEDSPFDGTAFHPADRQNGFHGEAPRRGAALAVVDRRLRLHLRRPFAQRRWQIAPPRIDARAWWSSHAPAATTAPQWLLAGGCAVYFLLFLAPGSGARIDFPRDTWSSPWWLQVGTSGISPASGKSPLATVCVNAG